MEKKILTGIGILFFTMMIIFTFVSRYTAIALLPEVTTAHLRGDGWISESAIAIDEAGGYYVLIITEKDSILGKTSVVNKVPVVIQKKNRTMVKLKNILQYSNFEFVIDASEEITNGDRVRRE